VILAAAGLKRLGLEPRIAGLLTPEQSIPAVGQGAIGIECRADRTDLQALLQILNHADTAWCVHAERAVSRSLGGSCTVPLGAFATIAVGRASMRGFVASPDGTRMARADGEVAHAPDGAELLGQEIADRLAAAGAREILSALEGVS
jgi:hydroxymethylbilane synthase